MTRTWDANPNGRYPCNVVGDLGNCEYQRFFYAPRVTRAERGHYNDHPTPKPIALMRWLARLFCPKNGVVLDPFMGSGSTGLGAIQESRGFIGIEINQHYVDIAERRLKEIASMPEVRLRQRLEAMMAAHGLSPDAAEAYLRTRGL